jgi:hypothetical protein
VQAELEAKLGAVDMSDALLPKRTEVKEELQEVKTSAAKAPKAPAEEPVQEVNMPMPPAAPKPQRPAPPVPRPAPVARTALQPPPKPATHKAPDIADETAAVQSEPETLNPADLYALLGVPMDAPFSDIKK